MLQRALLPFLLLLPQDDEKGFVPVFNGKDLTGLKFQFEAKDVDPSKTFSVKEGTLVCTGSPNGYWYAEGPYRDFTLRFEWRYKRPEGLTDEEKFTGNSGYLLFVTEHKIWPRGIEVQGMNRDVAGIIPIACKEETKSTTDAEARKKARKPVGEWNSMEIVAKGGRIEARLNGTLVSTVTEHPFKEGAIGFQSEGAEIHWRNVRIREEKP
jgi:3-keto-disaccharide hydrolase